MTKLPEPFKKSGQQIGPDGNNRMFFDAYTKEQMLQFRQDALQEAAKVADATVCDTHIPTGVKIYGQRAGKAIRALLKETNVLTF
jgi:hypothetical protein